MSDEDFDIESLAAYMHMLPAQIAKLADRGEIPGRKIAGKWRFSGREIHHWLEQRIGLADDQALAAMESVLERNAPADEEQLTLTELLLPEAIATALPARTRGSVVTAMTELAAATGYVWDAKKLADAVRAREELYPTALESGVALLHPRRPMPSILGQAFLALGITPAGVPFGGRQLTDVFFLIGSVTDAGHLRALARLSRLISDPEFLAELRAAPEAATAYDLIARRDEQLG